MVEEPVNRIPSTICPGDLLSHNGRLLAGDGNTNQSAAPVEWFEGFTDDGRIIAWTTGFHGVAECGGGGRQLISGDDRTAAVVDLAVRRRRGDRSSGQDGSHVDGLSGLTSA